MLKAIIEQLKTGSITNIITRGNLETYPSAVDSYSVMAPYVLVYSDYPLNTYYTMDNTITPFIVDVHYPMGYITEVNKYIEEEIIDLLHRKRLTTEDGYNFQVYVTSHISIMSEPNDDRSITGGNDDKTISRYRRIFVPRRGL